MVGAEDVRLVGEELAEFYQYGLSASGRSEAVSDPCAGSEGVQGLSQLLLSVTARVEQGFVRLASEKWWQRWRCRLVSRRPSSHQALVHLALFMLSGPVLGTAM